jgi:acyl-CoA dehydrogenase
VPRESLKIVHFDILTVETNMNLPYYGFFESLIPSWGVTLLLVLAILHFGFYGYGVRRWLGASVVFLYGYGAGTGWWIGWAVVAVLFGLPFVRQILSLGVMKLIDVLKFLPTISKTEQEAIDAGTTWVEGELFSGRPDFKRIYGEAYPGLTEEEQAFIDGPAQEVCEATEDWDVFQRRDLSPETWELLKKHRFFGMIIPKEYGGLGFSASANSAVVGKMSSANAVLGITVMVPNSLGPAELLIHYGTDEQKNHYLPRLASHEEIPAFALTEPNAGSDAGAMTSHGEVFKGEDGRLKIRLNWSKRYITLAPISTVLGLAFKLYDPENLLGKGKSLGVTCALIPTSLPGVDNSHRHDPLSIPFYNGPTYGHDVVVDLENAVIGGTAGVGRGWRMLMESLAAGRGISLPAVGTFGTKMVARVAGAHAVVRKQFGLSIGKFEGIEEPLARIGGYAYLLEAARRYTNGGLNSGAKPAVVTAIMKYNSTELFRKAIDDGMDILGGNAISMGPRNAIAHAYINTPIGITVEGANILTRTLIIFGQGAIRSHPFVLREINALSSNDVKAFDKAFWGHIGMVVQNIFRSVLLSASRGRLATSPVSGVASRYVKKLAWASASFSILADLALGLMGGTLKRKEMITGRFADIFSWMYLASTTLVRFEAEGRKKEDEALFVYAMDTAFHRMQIAFDELFSSLRLPVFSWLFRGPVGMWSRMNRLSGPPKDREIHRIARIYQTPGSQRDRLTDGIYVPSSPERPVGRLDRAMIASIEAEEFTGIMRSAVKSGSLPRGPIESQLEAALAAKLLTSEQVEKVRYAEKLRDDAVQVDSFGLDEYLKTAVHN